MIEDNAEGRLTLKNYTGKELVGLIQSHWQEVSTPGHETAIYLYRVRDLSFVRSCETLKAFNLSVSEFDILATLRRSPKPYILTPSELQRSLLITSGGLTKLLYQLEEEGLISRSMHAKDKRSKLVHLSTQGKRKVELAMAAIQQTLQSWLEEAYSQQELEQLQHLLSKAAAVLEKV